MAVTIQKKDWGSDLEKLGVSNSDINYLAVANIIPIFTHSGIKFVLSDGEVINSVKIPLSELQETLKGIVGSEEIADKLTSAIEYIKLTAKEGGFAKASKPLNELGLKPKKLKYPKPIIHIDTTVVTKPLSPTDKFEKLKAASIEQFKQATYQQEDEVAFNTAFMESGDRVKLIEATKLYQPVFGTDDSSRYFLVAANKDLKVAARYLGQKLSIRVEGVNIDAYASLLGNSGLGLEGTSGSHYSVHFVDVNTIDAAKALGAVVVGLGKVMDTPMPMIDALVGKGC